MKNQKDMIRTKLEIEDMIRTKLEIERYDSD